MTVKEQTKLLIRAAEGGAFEADGEVLGRLDAEAYPIYGKPSTAQQAVLDEIERVEAEVLRRLEALLGDEIRYVSVLDAVCQKCAAPLDSNDSAWDAINGAREAWGRRDLGRRRLS